MKRTLTFKDVDWSSTCKGHAKIEIELEPSKNGPCLSICAYGYQAGNRAPFVAGQCLDTLMESSLKGDPLFREVYSLWKRYHLNDMHAGTQRQEALIKEGLAEGKLPDMSYATLCAYLAANDMLFDGDYHYGSSWLYEPIPEADLARLEAIINGE